MEGHPYYVGIGEMKVAHNPHRLIIMGLGSCIGLALYDPGVKVGGVAHIMLPECGGGGRAQGQSQSQGQSESQRCKFADTAVPLLVEKMVQHKADKSRMIAKLAGGASIFTAMDALRIGERNAEVVKEKLKHEGIKVAAEDTGGNCARTIVLDTCTGRLSVKTKEGIQVI